MNKKSKKRKTSLNKKNKKIIKILFIVFNASNIIGSISIKPPFDDNDSAEWRNIKETKKIHLRGKRTHCIPQFIYEPKKHVPRKKHTYSMQPQEIINELISKQEKVKDFFIKEKKKSNCKNTIKRLSELQKLNLFEKSISVQLTIYVYQVLKEEKIASHIFKSNEFQVKFNDCTDSCHICDCYNLFRTYEIDHSHCPEVNEISIWLRKIILEIIPQEYENYILEILYSQLIIPIQFLFLLLQNESIPSDYKEKIEILLFAIFLKLSKFVGIHPLINNIIYQLTSECCNNLSCDRAQLNKKHEKKIKKLYKEIHLSLLPYTLSSKLINKENIGLYFQNVYNVIKTLDLDNANYTLDLNNTLFDLCKKHERTIINNSSNKLLQNIQYIATHSVLYSEEQKQYMSYLIDQTQRYQMKEEKEKEKENYKKLLQKTENLLFQFI